MKNPITAKENAKSLEEYLEIKAFEADLKLWTNDLYDKDDLLRVFRNGFMSRQNEVDKLKQLVEELQELNGLLNRKQ